jgi:hypothetical protein
VAQASLSKCFWHRLVFTQNILVRDRPFNLKGGLWFFVLFRIFFSDNTIVRILFFLSRKARNFLQILTLDFMTKTLNQIIFFSLHQNQNIFFSIIGNQNIFLEKNHNPPPLQVKWSFPKKSVNFTPSNIESHPIKPDDTFHTLHSNIYTMNILLSKAV